jgi:hypothetical protein
MDEHVWSARRRRVMRKEQSFVGWLEGYETADEVLDATILAMMKPCGPRSTCPARYCVSVKMPDGTTRTRQSAFFCSGAECELVEMMVMGSNGALWYDAAYCLSKAPRRCEVSIVLETVETPMNKVFEPRQTAHA